MRSVRISLKTARALLELLETNGYGLGASQPFKELRAAMAPKKSVHASAARRVVKKATKKEKRRDVRAEVMKRAGLRCECCGGGGSVFNPLTLDHMFGRVRVPETVENCWALCLACHHQKTDNNPTAVGWFKRFANHCVRHGYEEQAVRAIKDGEWRQAKNESSRAASMTRGATP